MTKKEDEKKEEIVNEPPKREVKSNGGELKTLFELVENSTVSKFKIGVNLSKKGYLKQYYEEEKKHNAGFFIEPSMTELEFKKIIGE